MSKIDEFISFAGNDKNINAELRKAMCSTNLPEEELIPEPLDKAIYPDPCEHEFLITHYSQNGAWINYWVCSKCRLAIQKDEIAYLLNHYTDIENWRNDEDK